MIDRRQFTKAVGVGLAGALVVGNAAPLLAKSEPEYLLSFTGFRCKPTPDFEYTPYWAGQLLWAVLWATGKREGATHWYAQCSVGTDDLSRSGDKALFIESKLEYAAMMAKRLIDNEILAEFKNDGKTVVDATRGMDGDRIESVDRIKLVSYKDIPDDNWSCGEREDLWRKEYLPGVHPNLIHDEAVKLVEMENQRWLAS